MSTKDENPLVKLIKKSVGLPTGQSTCCGSAATASPSASAEVSQCCEAQPAESKPADCCGSQAQAAETAPTNEA